MSLGLAACGDGRTAGSASVSQAVPSGGMTYRTNPTTGDKVSLLGYGCMRWPSVGGRSAREGNEEIDQEMVNRLVDFAIEHGVNYFDTSPAYCRGTSERATGIALSRHPREKYLIATKMSNFAPSTWTREGAIAMYHNSMKELQVDYLDYYLLHGIGMGSGMEEMMTRYFDNGIIDFLMEERNAGRIRNLGFSYHGDVKCFDWLLERHDVYKWDFVQIQLNYLDWRYAKQINPLTDEEFQFLQDTATRMMQFDTIPCNDCKYCMPCPYGLDIPAILLHYNKCLNEGNIPESSTDPEYRKARRAYLVGYDRSVPRLRQASHCIGCGQCSPHCPQRIDIPAELHRIDAYVERLRQNTL